MSIRLCRHSVFAILPGVLIASAVAKASAQAPAQPGVVTNRQGVDLNGKPVRRYPIIAMAAATKARVRELIAIHHPDALSNSSSIGELTFILGPQQAYVSSAARPLGAKASSQIDAGVAFLPSTPRSAEYTTFAAGELGPRALRVVVVNVM